ncbi:MAG: hypothetical protein AABY22_16465 [Nanoarchaeota archaeon]
MSRLRNIYQVEALFIGPAPATGFSQIDKIGNLNNNIITGSPANPNYNLLQNIPRVQSISYSLPVERNDVVQIGKRGFLHRGINYNSPITLNFEYFQNSILQELRLGFNANFARYFSDFNGSPFYSNNTGVSLLEGFVSRSDERLSTEFSWPLKYRDSRCIYVVVGREGDDLKENTYQEISSKATGLSCYGFGNSVLTSYRAVASVGDFPRASVSYNCDNMRFYSSGSGAQIPAINPRDGSPSTGIGFEIKFAIPSLYEPTGMLSVVRPGNITLDITALRRLEGYYATYRGYGGTSGLAYADIDNIGALFQDIKLQNYSIDLILNRKDKHQIGYKFPLDHVVISPTICNITFGAIIGNGQTGSFANILNNNDDYNITIKLKNPPNYPSFGGMTAIQYDFKRAKFSSINYEASIGTEKKVDVSFSCEIDDEDIGKGGMFMSGLFNIPLDYVTSTALLAQDGSNILFQNNSNIIANQIGGGRPMF